MNPQLYQGYCFPTPLSSIHLALAASPFHTHRSDTEVLSVAFLSIPVTGAFLSLMMLTLAGGLYTKIIWPTRPLQSARPRGPEVGLWRVH